MRRVTLGEDFPIRNTQYPPGLAGFSCRSEDEVLFGIIYYAEGRCNPTVVLCHGFPGMEKNADLAQNLRLAGINAVIFFYRGAWGSRGAFTFMGVAADALNVVNHIADEKMPCPERFDPGKIVLVGHSMGAFSALRAASRCPEIKDIALLSPWNIGRDARISLSDEAARARVNDILSSAGCLQGTSRAALWNEILRHPEEFDLCRLAPAFKSRRVLMVGAQDDESTPLSDHHQILVDSYREAGAKVTEKILPGDHSFSSMRNSVSRHLLDWLADCGY